MTIDFKLDDTVAGIRDFVHQFAETQLRPLAREADEKAEIPLETMQGFRGLRWQPRVDNARRASRSRG